jgi:hypothetical protein
MTGHLTATTSIDRHGPSRDRHLCSIDPRIGIGMAVAAGLLGLAILDGASAPAQGGDEPTPGKQPVSHSAVAAEARQTLKADELRLISLANQILEEPGVPGKLEEQLERSRIDAMKAEGEYQYTMHRREIAEMALKEYTEAILPHELAAANSQLSIAQADQVRAREQAKQANGRVGKMISDLEETRTTFALQQAAFQREALMKYTRSHRTTELESQLAKARSEERARKAEWELAKGRIEKMQLAAAEEPRHADVRKRILSLLDRATPIEGAVQAKLHQFAKEPTPGAGAEPEIRRLLDELGTMIDEAEAVKAADDLARLKPRIQKAARRTSTTKSS